MMKSLYWRAGALLVIGVACSTEPRPIAPNPDAGATGAPPLVAIPDGGSDGASEASAPPACIGTECPPGFATCVSGEVGSASHECGVNLMRDNANCGACGNACPMYVPLHMTSRCVEGACELQCHSPVVVGSPKQWRNCNGKIDDGCESDVLSDSENCGACGNACDEGVPCVRGKCGCEGGKMPCNGQCVDLMVDDNNCGACGNRCSEFPVKDPCVPLPPRTQYGCAAGTCGNLLCKRNTADCNGDLPTEQCKSDGCEVSNIASDPKNCGGCGIECAPGEECIAEETGSYCGIPCAKYNQTLCGTDCRDLLNDADACGACGVICPAAGPNQTRGCEKGVCAYECVEGFGDCNGDPSDGCEVDLRAHPEHCGACGNQCDRQVGQPCIDGRCLLVDCDDPGAR